MALLDALLRLNALSARALNVLQPLVALGMRLWIAEVFLRSGWLKITSWDSTLSLFESEYRVPLLPPHVAAVAGTFGELFFPVLLVLGLAGRIGAAGLFCVNVMAVVSYAHVLLSDGFEAAIGQHYLWGLMLLVLSVYGPGQLSIDHLLTRARRASPVATASTAAY
jgi:putative oxidoreductase